MNKGISVGSNIKISFLKSGVTKKGTHWQFFNYYEAKKNQSTGEYDTLGRYTIWVNNPNNDLRNGDYVTIKSITKAVVEKKNVNGIEYNNLNIYCDIEFKNSYTPQLVNKNEQSNINGNQSIDFLDDIGNCGDLPFD